MEKAIIFGAGSTGRLVYKRISTIFQVIAFCDNDKLKQGTALFDVPIISPNDIGKMFYDKIIIGTDMRDSMYKQLTQDLNVSHDVIMDEPMKIAEYTARRKVLFEARDIIVSRQVKGNVAEVGVFQGEFASKINEAFPDTTLYLFMTIQKEHNMIK